MPIRTQAERNLSLSTPLGDDALLLKSFAGTEQLGGLFRYELALLSEDGAIAFNDIVGQNVTVRYLTADGEHRYFNGYVSRFVQTADGGRLAAYQATVVPWLWFLTRTADCRIFQNKSVPDIVKEVFRDSNFNDFEEMLSGNYAPWENCVQYRESDFDFVSRLMEHEGIYYYFKHEDGKHILSLSDSRPAHEPFPGYEQLPWRPADDDQEGRESVWNWVVEQEVQPGVFAHNDYDFKAPRKPLRAKGEIIRQHATPEFEWYDYPGKYVEAGAGEGLAKTRIEEFQSRFETARAQTDARGVATGYIVELADHPRGDQNREYLITSTSYLIRSTAFDADADIAPSNGRIRPAASAKANDAKAGNAGDDAEAAEFRCTFTALEALQPFRPPRVTRKPVVSGPQTAIVVGPAGEEIHTDAHGRVRVHFHWDRHKPQADEESSCWMRVSQAWAGKQWGAMHLPRVGQEVIVDFLEGDPDQPIITGRVYNGDNMPVYALPANKTQSGIKSRSSKGGGAGNFNEIRMEDKKGSEQLYIHAEKDESIVVENDKGESVGHDETISIGHDRAETVGHDETIGIGNDRVETVGGNETLSVAKNRTRTVSQNETVTVALLRTHTVGINEAITVGAAQEVTVGAAQTITVGAVQATSVGMSQSNTVGGSRTLSVGKRQTTTIGSDQTVNVGGNGSLSVGGNRNASVGKNDALKVTNKLVIDAGDEVTIKTGSASITMKKDGTIAIQGKDITIKGSGEIGIKAANDMKIKGQNVLAN